MGRMKKPCLERVATACSIFIFVVEESLLCTVEGDISSTLKKISTSSPRIIGRLIFHISSDVISTPLDAYDACTIPFLKTLAVTMEMLTAGGKVISPNQLPA